MVDPKLLDAIRLIQSLEPSELYQLALGHRVLAFEAGKFQLLDHPSDRALLLFEGGNEWLEARVPEHERHGEYLRRYILDYIEEVFDYVVACWKQPAVAVQNEQSL